MHQSMSWQRDKTVMLSTSDGILAGCKPFSCQKLRLIMPTLEGQSEDYLKLINSSFCLLQQLLEEGDQRVLLVSVT